MVAVKCPQNLEKLSQKLKELYFIVVRIVNPVVSEKRGDPLCSEVACDAACRESKVAARAAYTGAAQVDEPAELTAIDQLIREASRTFSGDELDET